MNRTECVRAIVWLDQVAAKAAEESAKLRLVLATEALTEWEDQGAAPTWRIPDIATVSAVVSHGGVRVVDEAAFIRWVEQRYPTEVETIKKVRTAWQKSFFAAIAAAETGDADPNTGEVIPGVEATTGGQMKGVSIRVSAAAKEVFGALAEHGLKQLAADAGPAVPVTLAEIGGP